MLNNLEKIMRERNLTKYRLAKMCDIPFDTVNSFWRYGANNVKLSTLIKLSEGLNVSLDMLVFGKERFIK